ncbi:hypothetical protein L6164_021434 [Bauhinia variegata]|uniref:Uncharacterized protein n=1 Tax=Bauhinia variegata TaxID=167791 RepID=A0ACB9MYI6_BAUVA|nr:hypothetical protein L6164_021434 [Bauhinia variegata]
MLWLIYALEKGPSPGAYGCEYAGYCWMAGAVHKAFCFVLEIVIKLTGVDFGTAKVLVRGLIITVREASSEDEFATSWSG